MKRWWAVVVALAGFTVVAAACTVNDIAPQGLIQLTNPDRITVAAPDMSGAHVAITRWVYDPLFTNHAADCDTPPGDLYPIGETIVTCVAADQFQRFSTRTTKVIVTPPTGDEIVRVEKDFGSACVVYQQGSVRCWGNFAKVVNGQLVQSDVPVEIAGITSAVDVEVLQEHICVLLSNGVVECWGSDPSQTFPDGIIGGSLTPQAVPGFTNVVDLSSQCAVISGGTVRCFKTPGTTSTPAMYSPPGVTNAVSTEGPCARLADATMTCWWNETSQATGAAGLTGVSDIGATLGTSCAVKADTTAVCWGLYSYGQLGNGMVEVPPAPPQATPVAVSGLSGVTSIDNGPLTTCATLADGTARCWGLAESGSLGDGVLRDVGAIHYAPTPQVLVGVTNVVQISVGVQQGCVLLADGTVRCWGVSTHGGSVAPYYPGSGIPGQSMAIVPVTVTGLD